VIYEQQDIERRSVGSLSGGPSGQKDSHPAEGQAKHKQAQQDQQTGPSPSLDPFGDSINALTRINCRVDYAFDRTRYAATLVL
jgi:hypothetical protein